MVLEPEVPPETASVIRADALGPDVLGALVHGAHGIEAGPAWYERAASIVADLFGARRAAFWRLRSDHTLALELRPFGFADRELELLNTVTIAAGAHDTATRVAWAGESVAGRVDELATSDAYLAPLSAVGIHAHVTEPWELGGEIVGMVAVYDVADVEGIALPSSALRVAGMATLLIAELKQRKAHECDLAAREERRSREVALIESLTAAMTALEDIDAILHEGVRAAAQIVSRLGATPRRAAYLRRVGDDLIAVAEYDELGERMGGKYRLHGSSRLTHVVETGEPIVDDALNRPDLEPFTARVARRHNITSTALVPVRSSGEVIGVLVVAARDAAGFDDLEMRLLTAIADIMGLAKGSTERNQALRRAAERSQQLEELKGEFLNVAAHELRSPLGVLRGYISMLRERSVPDDQMDRVLELLSFKGAEMSRLVDEMLETASIEDRGARLSIERVDLIEIIDGAIAAMAPSLGALHELIVQGDRTPLRLNADRRRLTTVFTNLIDNAIKFSPNGGRIEVSWEVSSGDALIRVADHGMGIRVADLRGLFRRFGRIVTSENSHIRGTGLGLYLAREIVTRHGGDITAQSALHRGSTFTVTIPIGESS